MHRGISVIITVRGQEPYLKQTIANIRAKIGCPFEIITVWDGTKPDVDLDVDQIIHIRSGKGVGPARHAGIQKASNDLIFLTDAHMDFSPGLGTSFWNGIINLIMPLNRIFHAVRVLD